MYYLLGDTDKFSVYVYIDKQRLAHRKAKPLPSDGILSVSKIDAQEGDMGTSANSNDYIKPYNQTPSNHKKEAHQSFLEVVGLWVANWLTRLPDCRLTSRMVDHILIASEMRGVQHDSH